MGKKRGVPGDYPSMQDSCGDVRQSISASLDGEATPLAPAGIELHLAGCDVCRQWREAAHEVTRQYRLQVAQVQEPAPAALRSLVMTTLPRQRSWVIAWARVALAIVGVAQGVITGRLLISGDIDRFRDLGALGAALGVGFLVAAVRPYRAVGMLPIVATAAALLVGAALFDLARHRTTASDEVPHLLALAGWLLITLLAWRTPDLGAPPSVPHRWIARMRRSIDMGSRSTVATWADAMVPAASVPAQDPTARKGEWEDW
jgi:predicted anti-sigma-YlaC factor YlaD